MQWLKSLFAPRASPAAKPLLPPADVYLNLRSKVLELANDHGAPAANVGGAIALLMEDVHPPAVVTLATVSDGTTSLYFSNGGGILGTGQHAEVSRPANAWLERGGEEFASEMSPTQDFPLPAVGRVRFYLVKPGQVLSAEVPEEALVRKQHPLWPLWLGAQVVINAIQENSPK